MLYHRWLWIIGLLGPLGVAGCCPSRSGEGSRLCILPGFFKARAADATIATSSASAPIVYEGAKPALPSFKEDSPGKPAPKMPPVTELPAAPSLPQRLVPPPRVPAEASPMLNLPPLPRPTELPTLPPLAAPPEARLQGTPGDETLIIPTDHVADTKRVLPEIIQIGAADLAPALSAAKSCEGEPALLALVKAKAGKSHPVARFAIPEKRTEEAAEPAKGTKTLSGRVQQWRGSWVLRYASVDAVDEHGGSVVLFGGPELGELREGQSLSVQGVLIPAELRHESAHFRVVRFVDKQ